MNNEQFSRTIGLLGEDEFTNLQNKKVFIAGLGGVGGTVFEALIRTGITHFIIVDRDNVDISNLNRQLLFTQNDIGRSKVEVAKARALSINPKIDIITDNRDVKDIDNIDADMIVDCIDDVKAKVHLIKYACDHNIPVITSMGMANKLDPSQIRLATLNKSTVDPLAKKVRYELKQAGIDYSNLMCVFSYEEVHKDGNRLNSLMTVTSTAGLQIAYYVINILKNN